jgi:hypothetical protein
MYPADGAGVEVTGVHVCLCVQYNYLPSVGVGRHIDMPVVVGATKPLMKSTPISYYGLLYGAIDCATLLLRTYEQIDTRQGENVVAQARLPMHKPKRIDWRMGPMDRRDLQLHPLPGHQFFAIRPSAMRHPAPSSPGTNYSYVTDCAKVTRGSKRSQGSSIISLHSIDAVMKHTTLSIICKTQTLHL